MGINLSVVHKVRKETRKRFWHVRRLIIYISLISTFLAYESLLLKYLMPESLVFSHAKFLLFPYFFVVDFHDI